MRRNNLKKFAALTMSCVMAMGCFSAVAFAEEESKDVTLRIEGINGCIYYDSLEVKGTTVTDLLKAADDVSDKFEAVIKESAYGSYLSAINDAAESSFGGYDGWMFMVNGKIPDLGMDYVELSDGDSITFFYGDPYGAGFQYPEADVTKLEDGIITFTSKDTEYDANWNPTDVINPVVDATVSWGYGDSETVTFVTDKAGQIKIDEKYLLPGKHSLNIEKKNEAGLPLALRLAPDYAVEIAEKITVSLRIEGVNECVFDDKVTTDAKTITDILKAADAQSDKFEAVIEMSTYGNYLSAINSDVAGMFGGYDGWMFRINGVEPSMGMDYVEAKDGDEIVFYYGDSYGTGFQFPEINADKIEEGIIVITSKDTVYDENWNATEVVNPVVGATFKWYYSDTEFVSYVTDENGQVTIAKEYLTKGDHRIAVERYADNKIPTLLRLPYDSVITLTTDVPTADANSIFMYLLTAAVAVTLITTCVKRVNEE